MIPITSGLSLSLVWSGSTVVPLLIYDTVEPCGSLCACVFSFFPPSAQISLIGDVMESCSQSVTAGIPQPG